MYDIMFKQERAGKRKMQKKKSDTGRSAKQTKGADMTEMLFDAAKADMLFQRDPHWLGGDGAYSIDLGEDRILWLFGDSLIDADGSDIRSNTKMVHNSLAIQNGTDPENSELTYFWRKDSEGQPISFFEDTEDGCLLWPGHGLRTENGLLLFMMRIRGEEMFLEEAAMNFNSDGWEAVFIDNPEQPPSEWNLEWLDHPQNDWGIMVGSASVIEDDGYVYAFSPNDGEKDIPLYVARWSIDHINNKDLHKMEWWCGDALGWQDDKTISDNAPHALFDHAQAELSIHYNQTEEKYFCIQSEGFGETSIAFRSAAQIEGPWSDTQTLHAPPTLEHDKHFRYAAKAHPHLSDEDGLVMTFVVNSLCFENLIEDASVYFPRFVKTKHPKP